MNTTAATWTPQGQNEKPRPEPRARAGQSDLVKLLLLTLVGAAVGALAARFTFGAIPAPDSVKENKWLVVACVPLLAFLSILLHELGHVAGGWLAGFRFALLILGPFRVERSGSRIRCTWNRSWALAGGMAGSMPVRFNNLRRGMLLMVAGGPLVSLLSTLLALAAGWLLIGSLPTLGVLCYLFGIVSGGIAIATLIPSTLGGFTSDGGRLLQLARGGPAVDRWCALAALAGLSMANQRPREWPAALIEQATAQPDQTFDHGSAAWMRYSFHWDRNEKQQAAEWMAKALESAPHWPAAARHTLYAGAAYHFAMENHDATQAREFLNQAGTDGFLQPEQLLLAEGAVRLAEGDREGALAAAAKGLAAHAGCTDINSVLYRELLEDLRNKASGVTAWISHPYLPS
jgi:hypothetical protein